MCSWYANDFQGYIGRGKHYTCLVTITMVPEDGTEQIHSTS